MAFSNNDYKHRPGDEGGKGKKLLVPMVKLNVGKTVVAMFPNSRLGKWVQKIGWGK